MFSSRYIRPYSYKRTRRRRGSPCRYFRPYQLHGDLNMISEVSRYDIERLESSPAYLEKEVRRLADELRAADLRQFRERLETEPRFTKWSMMLFGLSLAFSLFITVCATHPKPADSETAVKAPAERVSAVLGNSVLLKGGLVL